MVKTNNPQKMFYVLSFTRSNVLYSPTLISHWAQTSNCFLSYGINNMHILASGPEIQAVRFGYVILGKNLKKGYDPQGTRSKLF